MSTIVDKTMNTSLPVRSNEGMAALDIFYVNFNDVNFYVEDADQENLYEVILKRSFPEVKFERIFPLGGKDEVIKHAGKLENRNISRKQVYIVDKDFDDFLRNFIIDERMFYLDRYCIENHILDCAAIVQVVIETYPKKKAAELAEKLDLPRFESFTYQSLWSLFTLFCSVQILNLGLKNCDCKPEEYSANPQTWIVDEVKIAAYKDAVVARSDQRGLRLELERVIQEIEENTRDYAGLQKIVSGKFVLAMIFHYVKHKFTLGSITFDSFVFRIAKNHDFESLRPLIQRIQVYLAR